MMWKTDENKIKQIIVNLLKKKIGKVVVERHFYFKELTLLPSKKKSKFVFNNK